MNEKEVATLFKIITEGDVEELKQRQNNGLRINFKFSYQNQVDWTPLSIACYNGDVEIVKLLLMDKEVDLNEPQNKNGETAFYIACSNRHIEIVKLLLNDQRVDVNKADNKCYTPLMNACEEGHIDIAKLLLNDKRVKLGRETRYGITSFCFACREGYIEIVELFIKNLMLIKRMFMAKHLSI